MICGRCRDRRSASGGTNARRRAAIGAREDILCRVRAAIAASGPAEPAEAIFPAAPDPVDGGTAVELLVEHLGELGVRVSLAAAGEAAAAAAAGCRELGARRIVVPDDWPEEWTPEGIEVEAEAGRPPAELGGFDAALTSARLGVAETGTIVLDGGERQGSRPLSLLPERHVCLLAAADVVPTFAAAMEAMRSAPGSGRTLTLISGPSATTDIELTRIEGVHGPRKLAVVILGP